MLCWLDLAHQGCAGWRRFIRVGACFRPWECCFQQGHGQILADIVLRLGDGPRAWRAEPVSLFALDVGRQANFQRKSTRGWWAADNRLVDYGRSASRWLGLSDRLYRLIGLVLRGFWLELAAVFSRLFSQERGAKAPGAALKPAHAVPGHCDEEQGDRPKPKKGVLHREVICDGVNDANVTATRAAA